MSKGLAATAKQLGKMRAGRRIAQREVGEAADRSTREIGHFERGDRKLPVDLIGSYLKRVDREEPVSEHEWREFFTVFLSEVLSLATEGLGEGGVKVGSVTDDFDFIVGLPRGRQLVLNMKLLTATVP